MFWIIVAGIIGAVVLLMFSGFGKNRIFTSPESYSDAELERIITLTARIVDNSPVLSEQWKEAGAKYSAALNEQRKRRGEKPIAHHIDEGGNDPESH